ncbi:unnamed protein product, partial [Urochloa humidicola]
TAGAEAEQWGRAPGGGVRSSGVGSRMSGDAMVDALPASPLLQ